MMDSLDDQMSISTIRHFRFEISRFRKSLAIQAGYVLLVLAR